jgi:hypothetical protein
MKSRRRSGSVAEPVLVLGVEILSMSIDSVIVYYGIFLRCDIYQWETADASKRRIK